MFNSIYQTDFLVDLLEFTKNNLKITGFFSKLKTFEKVVGIFFPFFRPFLWEFYTPS